MPSAEQLFLLATPREGGYDSAMDMLALIGSSQQWFILAIVFLVVFGASRLPDLARNLGKSLGILKKAKREFEEELMKAQSPETPSAPDALPVEQQAQAKAESQRPQGDEAPKA